jgi:hypothetical protein
MAFRCAIKTGRNHETSSFGSRAGQPSVVDGRVALCGTADHRHSRLAPRHHHDQRKTASAGTINKLTFALEPEKLTSEDRKRLPAIADALARAKD